MLSTNDVKQKLLNHLMELDLDAYTMDEKSTLAHILNSLSTLEKPTFEESMATMMTALGHDRCCHFSNDQEQIALTE